MGFRLPLQHVKKRYDIVTILFLYACSCFLFFKILNYSSKLCLEFDEFDVPEEEETSEEGKIKTEFSYAVIQSNGTRKSAWRVVNWIIHPNYVRDWRDLLLSKSQSARYEDITNFNSDMAQIRAEITKVDYDIALLKVEEDDSIISSSLVSQGIEDVLDEEHEETGDVWYDSLPGNNILEEPHNSACIEHMQQGHSSIEEVSNTRSSDPNIGAFKLPSERRRYDVNSQDNTTPRRASCVKVGYSPITIK